MPKGPLKMQKCHIVASRGGVYERDMDDESVTLADNIKVKSLKFNEVEHFYNR